MTHEEHRARAMLMGMVYDWRDSTYCFAHERVGLLSPHGMLDAKTLEPINSEATGKRAEGRGITNVDWSDPPTRDADYDD